MISATEETKYFRLEHSGTEVVPLSDASQEEEINLVRKDGNPALKRHHLFEMSPNTRVSPACEYFISSGKQRSPPAGSVASTSEDAVSVAHASLIEVTLNDVKGSHPVTRLVMCSYLMQAVFPTPRVM